MEKSQYIDLGLPSGTLWADGNVPGELLLEEAMSKYGNAIPTKEQVQELIDSCSWTLDESGEGFTVSGSNGNSIFLPKRDHAFGFYHTRSVIDAKHCEALSIDDVHGGELFVAMSPMAAFTRLVSVRGSIAKG